MACRQLHGPWPGSPGPLRLAANRGERAAWLRKALGGCCMAWMVEGRFLRSCGLSSCSWPLRFRRAGGDNLEAAAELLLHRFLGSSYANSMTNAFKHDGFCCRIERPPMQETGGS